MYEMVSEKLFLQVASKFFFLNVKYHICNKTQGLFVWGFVHKVPKLEAQSAEACVAYLSFCFEET
jgi:hypothetical protein